MEPLPEGTQLLRPRMCPAVGSGSSLFWELCSGGSVVGFFFPHPGLRFHAKIPLPHAVIRGLSPPGAGSPGRTDRTCWQSWSATRAAAPRAQQLDPGNPAAGFALRSPASVRPARLPKSNLGAWALTGDPGPREPEGSLSQHL